MTQMENNRISTNGW